VGDSGGYAVQEMQDYVLDDAALWRLCSKLARPLVSFTTQFVCRGSHPRNGSQ